MCLLMEFKITYPELARNGELHYGNNPTDIILHHPQWSGTAVGLNNMMIDMGFVMAGYNFFIRKTGEINALRPTNAIGGNCYGMNSKSLGLSFEGDYSKDQVMPQAQFDAGVWLIQYLQSQNKNLKTVAPHNKYQNTECPGKYFPVAKMIKTAAGASVITGVTPIRDTNYTAWNSGTEVLVIQGKLIKLGYKLTADGYFGKITFDAIKDFQTKHGLVADGIAGVNTVKTMDDIINIPKPVPVTQITIIQQTLNSLINAKLVTDGKAGELTAEAIVKFQGIVGLKQDGVWNTQLQACADQIKSKPVCRPGCNSYYAVRYIQYRMGCKIDGEYGATTMSFVNAYQKSKGLGADGLVGPNTWVALFK
jgi:peptidoglycan hydrolase-like protein with peptidoglycan-binding domain